MVWTVEKFVVEEKKETKKLAKAKVPAKKAKPVAQKPAVKKKVAKTENTKKK